MPPLIRLSTYYQSSSLKPSGVNLASGGETVEAGRIVSLVSGALAVFLGRFGLAGGFGVK